MESIKKISTDTDVLLDAFGLNKIYHQSPITDWTSASGELTPMQKALLDDIHQRSFDKVSGWNEEEVKMKLISFLLYISDIEERGKISTFFEREMSADIQQHRLSVTCDCLVAALSDFLLQNCLISFCKNLSDGNVDKMIRRVKCSQQCQ